MKRHTERLVALQILCAVLLGAGLSRSAGKPGTDRSPLDVAGTSVLVTGAPGTLTVTIATRDRHAAREVITRARALVPAR